MNWNWNFAKATCRPADLGSVRLSTKPATGALFTFRYNRQLQVLLISHSFLTWPKLDRTMYELRRYKNTKTTSKWPQALPKHPQPPWQDFCSLLAGRKKTQSTLKRLQSKIEDMFPCVQLLYHMTNPSCTENYERLSSHLLHCLHQSLEHEGTMLHEFTFASKYTWGIGYQRAILAQRYQIKIVIVWRWLECCQSYILCRRHFISW